MKGSMLVLALMALVLIFGVSTLWAQDEYCRPLDKTLRPGVTTITFDDIIYHFTTISSVSIRLEKLDDAHVRANIKPVKQEPRPYYEIGVQWGTFPGITVDVTGPDGGSYTFDTETGYAEK
jgi:hypothetical protein